METGCSHQVARREEFREPRLLAENSIYVLRQSQQASSDIDKDDHSRFGWHNFAA